jgi:hypothetical protein
MGASADRWAKRERHERRTARILEALREAAPITMDEEEVFL